jgi:hypothetical protein
VNFIDLRSIHGQGWLSMSVHRAQPIVNLAKSKEMAFTASDAWNSALASHLLYGLEVAPEMDGSLLGRY